jgi:anthranilate phosphoribosyltransferase
MLKGALDQAIRGDGLSESQAYDAARELAGCETDPVLAGALLIALRMKGESADEVRGFARAMRDLAVRPALPEPIRSRACDVVGTGGDGSHTFNISTGAALLAAACGLPIVKHGNRSISSQSGAADLLGELGVRTAASSEALARSLESTGFCFLFAPDHHPAAANVAQVRRTLGVRTIFNILGPLTNPAQPPFGVLGAYSLDTARLMADAISGLNIERVFVVHGAPAWDEPTPVGPFHLFDVRPNSVTHEVRDPADYGLAPCAPDALRGGDAAHNAKALRAVFDGERSPHRDALCLSCALALEVSGSEATMADGLIAARAALDGGRASGLLERLRDLNAEERTA